MITSKQRQRLQTSLLRAKQDPVYFAEHILRFRPFGYQEFFLRDGSPRIVAVCGRQVGKSTVASIRALHFALFNRGVTVIIVSASLNQSLLLFDKIARWFSNSLLLQKLLRNQTRRLLELRNGSEIVALPCGRTGFTLRGFTVDMAILDEANFMPADVIDGVVKPMLVTRPNSILIMLTTPWNVDHPVHEAFTNDQAGYSKYHWPTRLNPLVDKERLAKDYGGSDNPHFQREYEGAYTGDEDSYLPRGLITRCVEERLQYYSDPVLLPVASAEIPRAVYYAGVDLGKKQDHSVVAVLRRDDDARRLVLAKRFSLGAEYASVIGYLKVLGERMQHVAKVLVDQTGVGEVIVEEMRNNSTVNVEGITLTLPNKQEVMTSLRQMLTTEIDCQECGGPHPSLLIPYDPELIAEMNVEKFQLSKSGQTTFSHPAGTHDDRLWAVALAAYASREPPMLRYKPFTRSVSW